MHSDTSQFQASTIAMRLQTTATPTYSDARQPFQARTSAIPVQMPTTPTYLYPLQPSTATASRWRCRLAADKDAEKLVSLLKGCKIFHDHIKWLAVFSAREPQGTHGVEVWFTKTLKREQAEKIMNQTLGDGQFEELEKLTGAFNERTPLFETGQKDHQGRRLVTSDPVVHTL
jgi:hypothetical protein